MIYAATYPEQVAGMVLLDSSSPSQFTAVPAYPTQYASCGAAWRPADAGTRGPAVPRSSQLLAA